MTFAIVCPTCRVKSRVPDRLRGKRVRCLKCDARFVVPVPAAVGESAAGGRTPILSVRLPVILAVVSTGALLIVLFLFLKELSTPAVGSGGWMSGTFAEMGKRLMLFFWGFVLFATGAVTLGSWATVALCWTARRKREPITSGSRLQPGEGKWTGSQSSIGTG